MRCRKCQKLVHFYGADELSARRKRRMEKHLAECTACREVAAEIRQARAEIRALREEMPEIPHPEALTASVLRKIRLGSHPVPSARRAGGLDAVLEWVGTPFARGALITIAGIIIGLFATQEVLIVHRLDRLESAVGTANRATVDTRQYSSLEEALRSLDQAASGGETALQATLGRARVDSLLHEYQRLRRENDLLKRMILERFPELDRYIAGKPVSAEQLETLLRQYPGYINLLRRL